MRRQRQIMEGRDGIMVEGWLPLNTVIKNDEYFVSLQNLNRQVQQYRKGKWATALHTSHCTQEELMALGFTVLAHLPYSPDLQNVLLQIVNII